VQNLDFKKDMKVERGLFGKRKRRRDKKGRCL
jgi:hypothetical protein